MCITHCEACGSETELLTIKEAAYTANICRRTLQYWIKRGRLHLKEDAGGHTLICKGSLVRPYTKAR